MDAIAQKEHFNALRAKSQSKQKGESQDLQKVLGGGTTMKGLFLRKNKEQEIGDLEKSIAKVKKIIL